MHFALGSTVYRSQKCFCSSPPSTRASLLASRLRVESPTIADDEGCRVQKEGKKMWDANWLIPRGIPLLEKLSIPLPNPVEYAPYRSCRFCEHWAGHGMGTLFELQSTMMIYIHGSGDGRKKPSSISNERSTYNDIS